MGKCAAHPERETRFQCFKHELYLCEDCLKCRDPDIYCKHRPACPIHFIDKRRRRPAAAGLDGGDTLP
jgi:hypothetical protein